MTPTTGRSMLPELADLSPEEAHEYLSQFLETARLNVHRLLEPAAEAGIECDYSPESAKQLLEWVPHRLKTVRLPPNRGLPRFLRQLPEHSSQRFRFDDASSTDILNAGYYFGESFVRSFGSLRWDIGGGDVHTIGFQTPAVAGFRTGLELKPVHVTHVLMRRAHGGEPAAIAKAVDIWISEV